jgi:hypothetical protein
MKKINFMLIMISGILLISCGGNNDKKDVVNTDEITKKENECPLDQLHIKGPTNELNYNSDQNPYTTQNIKRNDEKENFTGVGIEKDQNDSILNKVEVKNGWLIRYTHRIKKDNKYITLSDLTFDSGKIMNGYKIVIEEKKPKIEYTSALINYQNGKEKYEWDIFILIDDYVTINQGYNENSEFFEETDKGMLIGTNNYDISNFDLSKSKAISGFKKILFLQMEKPNYFFSHPDEKTIDNALNSLKKELPKFDYWKK